jgi:hypothetical protein
LELLTIKIGLLLLFFYMGKRKIELKLITDNKARYVSN